MPSAQCVLVENKGIVLSTVRGLYRTSSHLAPIPLQDGVLSVELPSALPREGAYGVQPELSASFSDKLFQEARSAQVARSLHPRPATSGQVHAGRASGQVTMRPQRVSPERESSSSIDLRQHPPSGKYGETDSATDGPLFNDHTVDRVAAKWPRLVPNTHRQNAVKGAFFRAGDATSSMYTASGRPYTTGTHAVLQAGRERSRSVPDNLAVMLRPKTSDETVIPISGLIPRGQNTTPSFRPADPSALSQTPHPLFTSLLRHRVQPLFSYLQRISLLREIRSLQSRRLRLTFFQVCGPGSSLWQGHVAWMQEIILRH
jgi:hypothetical protein